VQVASEDTPFYTVQHYINRNPAIMRLIQQRLGPLIRLQHLSHFWLLQSVVSYDADYISLGHLWPQARQLLLLRSARASLTPADIQGALGRVPSAWLLGERAYTPVSEVELLWPLDVSALQRVLQHSVAQQDSSKGCSWTSPGVTPPLGGMAFGLKIVCRRVEGSSSSSSTVIDLYAGPCGVPADAWCSFTFELSAATAMGPLARCATTPVMPGTWGWGWEDFFGTGPMVGGWDAAVWASKGLPTTGSLVLKLKATHVGHMATGNTAQ
jgi:hypothetical protein